MWIARISYIIKEQHANDPLSLILNDQLHNKRITDLQGIATVQGSG